MSKKKPNKKEQSERLTLATAIVNLIIALINLLILIIRGE